MRLIRIGLVALVAAPLAFAAGGHAAAPPAGVCAAPVRGLDTALPAALTIRTSCGAFVLARDGSVTRVSSAASPYPRNAGWWPASGLWSRDDHGHVVIGRGRRVVWRSTERLPLASALDTVVLGRRNVAFSNGWRRSYLYVARLDGREHRVARDEFPIGWTSGGLYVGRNPDGAILLRNGRQVRRLAGANFRTAVYAPSSQSLYFVAGNRFVRANGSREHVLADLPTFGLDSDRQLELQRLGRLVALQNRQRLVVLRANGSLFASTALPRWRRGWPWLTGEPTAGVGGVAFAVMHAHAPDSNQQWERGLETVYLLRPGARAALPIHASRLRFNVCGHGAELAWHGKWLAYSTGEGPAALVDTRDSRAVELTSLIRRLPGFKGDDSGPFNVTWR